MDDRETVEHVPWAELTAAPKTDRRQALIIGAVAVAAALVGVVAGRVVFAAPSAIPGAAEEVEAIDEIQVEASDASEPSPATTMSAAPAAALYSEADLFAPDVAAPELAAAARAEWFVTDFFTVDLDPSGGTDVAAALPDDADLPARSGDVAGSVAYVEWARAVAVERTGTDTYRVDVVFRLIGAPPDRGYYRLPVKAVAVTVAVSPDGGTTVLDLPTPIMLPPGPEPVPWPSEEAEAPAEVIAGAVAITAGWGTEPRLLASQSVGDDWRVVMSVVDDVGNRWPLVIVLDATGRPVS